MSSTSKYSVNVDLANQTKKEMESSLQTDEKRVLNKIGAFSSLYDINFPEYKNPVLVMKTEEPGSKQLLAFKYDKIESVCYDMINHLINDCIVMGAKPLSVQDAIICGKMEKEKVKRIVNGISEACKEQECVLTGGETSEQPGVLEEGKYILTSSIVGIIDKKDIIDGSNIKVGDTIIGVASNGLHTNGYTLVRELLSKDPELENRIVDNKTFIDSVLIPHRCYYKTIKDLFRNEVIGGMAHITGGGVTENLNRILPVGVDAEVDIDKYSILPIFKVIKDIGNIKDREMLRIFNMGVGLVIIASPHRSSEIIQHIKTQNINCFEIGRIIKGNQDVKIKGDFVWK